MKHRNRVMAAIYARVSCEQQSREQTIASQVEALKARVARDGLALEEELCFVDDGYSGGTLVRPALERLRDQAAAGAVDRLYVHCPDRLARKYAYQVVLIDELRRQGIEVVFLNRAIAETAEDDLLLQVQGMIAEYERVKVLERSRRGKRHAALGARSASWAAPPTAIATSASARGTARPGTRSSRRRRRWSDGSSSGSAASDARSARSAGG